MADGLLEAATRDYTLMMESGTYAEYAMKRTLQGLAPAPEGEYEAAGSYYYGYITLFPTPSPFNKKAEWVAKCYTKYQIPKGEWIAICRAECR